MKTSKMTSSQQKQWHLKMRTTLLTFTCSLSLIPLLIMSIFFIVRIGHYDRNKFKTNSSTLNSIGIRFIDEKIDMYVSALDSIITYNDFDISTDPEYLQLRKSLQLVTSSDPSLLNAYFAGPNGEFVQALDGGLPEGFVACETTWYKNCIALDGEILIQEPYVDTITVESAFTIYKAFKKNGQTAGLVALDINLSALSPQLESIRYGKSGELLVVSPNGAIFVSPDHNMINTTEPLEYSSWNTIQESEQGTVEFTYNDISYAAEFGTSETTGWKFILRTPIKELSSIFFNFLILAIIWVIIVAIIAILLILRFSKTISVTVSELNAHIEKNAKGIFNEPLILNSRVT